MVSRVKPLTSLGKVPFTDRVNKYLRENGGGGGKRKRRRRKRKRKREMNGERYSSVRFFMVQSDGGRVPVRGLSRIALCDNGMKDKERKGKKRMERREKERRKKAGMGRERKYT